MLAPLSVADRTRRGRFLAAGFALLALLCFYQPWVSGTLPGVGERTLSGAGLARGEARRLVDAAAYARGGAGAQSAALTGGLVLPTRIPTVGPAGASSALATSQPAGGESPGQALPTRQPSGVAIATAAAATAVAVQTAQAGGTRESPVPAAASASADRLPAGILYAFPLAAAGLAIFALLWERLREPRDQLFGRWWTVLLAAGGTAGTGWLLLKVLTAPHPNDLLGPGEVHQAQWGLWATFTAFLLSAISISYAWWVAPRRRAQLSDSIASVPLSP